VVLADTSIWVDFLRRGGAGSDRLGKLLSNGEIVMCGPVAAELLAGIGERDEKNLWASLTALPWQGLDRDGWRAVGATAAALRRLGQRVPLIDVEIAVAAARGGAELWTGDAHFDRMVGVVPGLRLTPVR